MAFLLAILISLPIAYTSHDIPSSHFPSMFLHMKALYDIACSCPLGSILAVHYILFLQFLPILLAFLPFPP